MDHLSLESDLVATLKHRTRTLTYLVQGDVNLNCPGFGNKLEYFGDWQGYACGIRIKNISKEERGRWRCIMESLVYEDGSRVTGEIVRGNFELPFDFKDYSDRLEAQNTELQRYNSELMTQKLEIESKLKNIHCTFQCTLEGLFDQADIPWKMKNHNCRCRNGDENEVCQNSQEQEDPDEYELPW